MLEFQPLTEEALQILRGRFGRDTQGMSDNTFWSAWIWRRYFRLQWAMYGDVLCLTSVYPTEKLTAVSLPEGGWSAALLEELRLWAVRQHIPLCLCPVGEQEVQSLAALWPQAQAIPCRQWFDYVYAAADLRTLAGRRFGGQRNHVNRFLRENPDWHFEAITAENVGAVREFFEANAGKKSFAAAAAEQESLRELLRNWAQAAGNGLLGGALFVKNSVVGFALAERVADTLYVHAEKADRELHGAYPMVVQQTALAFAGTDSGIVWINREDDAGDTGLRTVKLSYHPVTMTEKYLVRLPV